MCSCVTNEKREEKTFSMELDVGAVITGKVTGIAKFGAFVSLPDGKSGLVHISEIANSYVNDVNDHLVTGQEVKVRVIGVDGATGKLNLSIKKAEEKPPAPKPVSFTPRSAPAPNIGATFEDKLKQFMQDSDSKISSLKKNSDKRGSRRRK